MAPVIIARDIRKRYAGFAPVLRGVNLEVEPGEIVAIMGPSGCGKSTMLHVLGLLHAPDSGTVNILGKDVLTLNREETAAFRRDNLGFVMQQSNLFDHSTVFENVEKLQDKENSNRLTTGQNHTLSLAAFAQEKALMTPCGDWSWNEIQNSTDPSKLDIMAAPLVCDPVTELVIAQATPSSEVFEGVDMSDAEAVAEAEKGYFKVARAEVSPSVIPESDADAEYIYFKKYTYSMAGQMEAVIPAGAKNIEYAKEFLTYLCTDDSLSLYTKYTGSNMPYEKSNTDPAINPDFYTFNTHCLELGQYGASIVSGSTTKAVRYGFASMLPGATMYIDLLNGSSTPDAIFTRMTDSIRRGMEGLEGLINNYEKDFIK